MKVVYKNSSLVFNKRADLNIDISALEWSNTAVNGIGQEMSSTTKVTSSPLQLKTGIGIKVSYNSSKYTVAYGMSNFRGEIYTNMDIHTGIFPFDAQQTTTRFQVRKKDGGNITVSEITDLNLKLTYISIAPIAIMLDKNSSYSYIKNLNLKKDKSYRFETTDLNSIVYLSTLDEILPSTQLTDDNRKKVFEGNGTSTTAVVTMDKDYNSAKIYSDSIADDIVKIREV